MGRVNELSMDLTASTSNVSLVLKDIYQDGGQYWGTLAVSIYGVEYVPLSLPDLLNTHAFWIEECINFLKLPLVLTINQEKSVREFAIALSNHSENPRDEVKFKILLDVMSQHGFGRLSSIEIQSPRSVFQSLRVVDFLDGEKGDDVTFALCLCWSPMSWLAMCSKTKGWIVVHFSPSDLLSAIEILLRDIKALPSLDG